MTTAQAVNLETAAILDSDRALAGIDLAALRHGEGGLSAESETAAARDDTCVFRQGNNAIRTSLENEIQLRRV